MGLIVCSLLTSMRNTPSDALAAPRSILTPHSYAHSRIGATVGCAITPSAERNPRDTFPYTPTSGDSFMSAPSLGDTTPCVALVDELPSGVERVASTS